MTSLHGPQLVVAKGLVQFNDATSHALQGHPRQTGLSGEFWQQTVHWRRKWQSTPAFLTGEARDSMKKQKNTTLEYEPPGRGVAVLLGKSRGHCPQLWEEWRRWAACDYTAGVMDRLKGPGLRGGLRSCRQRSARLYGKQWPKPTQRERNTRGQCGCLRRLTDIWEERRKAREKGKEAPTACRVPQNCKER